MYTNINILILQAQAHCNIVIEDIATILKIKQVALSMKPLPGSPMTGPSHFGVSVLQPQCSMKDWEGLPPTLISKKTEKNTPIKIAMNHRST